MLVTTANGVKKAGFRLGIGVYGRGSHQAGNRSRHAGRWQESQQGDRSSRRVEAQRLSRRRGWTMPGETSQVKEHSLCSRESSDVDQKSGHCNVDLRTRNRPIIEQLLPVNQHVPDHAIVIRRPPYPCVFQWRGDRSNPVHRVVERGNDLVRSTDEDELSVA